MQRRWRTAAGGVWMCQGPPGSLRWHHAGEGGQANSRKRRLAALGEHRRGLLPVSVFARHMSGWQTSRNIECEPTTICAGRCLA